MNKQRKLTHQEVLLIASIFGTQIDYDKVWIKKAWWVLPNYGVTPNGNLYVHEGLYVSDYSVCDVYTQAWFIHEMTHVWQYQQGMAVFLRAVFNRKYSYQLKANKDFLKYGIEQQASMVEHYFLAKALGKEHQALAKIIPFVSTSNQC